jgi:hypothetical protein
MCGHNHTDTPPKTTAGLDYIRGIELEHHQQLSIMHRAFDSEDIIYSVLDNLKSSPEDLINAAMTNSKLAGPALDILWAELSSFVPLIKCLSHDTLKYDDRTLVSAVYPVNLYSKIAEKTIVSEVYHLNLDSTMLTML